MRPNREVNNRGLALLSFVTIILIVISIIIITLQKTNWFQQKITSNSYKAEQAFEAAEAGLEYGIVYLEKNKSSIIVDTDNNGYIDTYTSSYTTNVTLTDGSKYSVTYSNPTANNFSVIQLASTGTSVDGTATKTIREQVYFLPMLMDFTTYSIVVQGDVNLSGGAKITNLSQNTNINSGGETSLSGSSSTETSAGTTSSSGSNGSDIQENISTLNSMSEANFIATIYGLSESTIQSNVEHYVTSDFNSNLNGLTNTSIWVEGDASISSNTTIGSATEPVIIFVNGDLTLLGSAEIYGFIYVKGDLRVLGNSKIHGGVAVSGDVTALGNFELNYDADVLDELKDNLGTYAVIPGSWNDFQQ